MDKAEVSINRSTDGEAVKETQQLQSTLDEAKTSPVNTDDTLPVQHTTPTSQGIQVSDSDNIVRFNRRSIQKAKLYGRFDAFESVDKSFYESCNFHTRLATPSPNRDIEYSLQQQSGCTPPHLRPIKLNFDTPEKLPTTENFDTFIINSPTPSEYLDLPTIQNLSAKMAEKPIRQINKNFADSSKILAPPPSPVSQITESGKGMTDDSSYPPTSPKTAKDFSSREEYEKYQSHRQPRPDELSPNSRQSWEKQMEEFNRQADLSEALNANSAMSDDRRTKILQDNGYCVRPKLKRQDTERLFNADGYTIKPDSLQNSLSQNFSYDLNNPFSKFPKTIAQPRKTYAEVVANSKPFDSFQTKFTTLPLTSYTSTLPSYTNHMRSAWMNAPQGIPQQPQTTAISQANQANQSLMPADPQSQDDTNAHPVEQKNSAQKVAKKAK